MVFAVVAAFGVDQHRLAGSTGFGEHLGDFGQHAFAVVRKNHGVVIGQQFAVAAQHVFQAACAGALLEIQTDQLLLAGKHAQLQGGFKAGAALEMRRHTVVAHQAFQRIGGIVFAANRQQRGLTAERGNIAGNVGGAAGTVFGFGDSRHRHRRFGRNARHVAKPVAVEHHVAHHQHAGGGKILALGNAVNHTLLQSQRRGRRPHRFSGCRKRSGTALFAGAAF